MALCLASPIAIQNAMSIRLVRLAHESLPERNNHLHKPAPYTLSDHSSRCRPYAPEPIESLEHHVAHAVDQDVNQGKLGVDPIQCNEKVIRLCATQYPKPSLEQNNLPSFHPRPAGHKKRCSARQPRSPTVVVIRSCLSCPKTCSKVASPFTPNDAQKRTSLC